ncbi:pre-mRNA splicing factor [Roridomyces roridus]|uniref:Pre-mRNA splicing factor n=1 Tax=Roridomyces roridus TaxID=1738132 RepID=A0AAD7FL81_9AGAR|nr:pre-mRNA splicing factor [Roridomyces roridus]
MSLDLGYASDSGEEDVANPFGLPAPVAKKPRVEESAPSQTVPSAAPHVLLEDPLNQTSLVTRPTDTQMNVNIPYSDMMLPVQGPENPFGDRNRFQNQNALAGHVEEQSMSEHAFKAQHLTHAMLGYSANPSIDPNAPAILGSLEKAQANGFATIDTLRAPKMQRKELKRKRKDKGDLEVVDGDGAYVGPWATWEGEEVQNDFLAGVEVDDEPEEEEEEPEVHLPTKKGKPKRPVGVGHEHSVFHGKSMTDYQGRTYMSAPVSEAPHLNSEAGSQDCFIPKVCIHTWTGHTQGVSVIRLFPETGHLLLSGSMDTKIKLWDVYTHGNCLRTFHGHTKYVKDVSFSNDGRQFLSCGYDRQMKLWDTETGQCLKRFSNGKIPHVIRFHPDEDKQHIFLAGMSDKKIIQFVTTSDDKTIRAWDYDIPVVIKYIAEPHMHSMPADNFRQNRKKRFAGHSVAGYACQVGFSPDGKWISSGDGEGNVVFWDWKTGRIKSRLKAHSKVVIAHEWLPHETSKVVTASWDGLIKLWD